MNSFEAVGGRKGINLKEFLAFLQKKHHIPYMYMKNLIFDTENFDTWRLLVLEDQFLTPRINLVRKFMLSREVGTTAFKTCCLTFKSVRTYKDVKAFNYPFVCRK